MYQWHARSPARLAQFLSAHAKEAGLEYSMEDIQWSIYNHRCWINKKVERFASHRLQTGDEICFWPEKKPYFSLEKERVLYEDDALLLYNKPASIDSPTLVARLNAQLVHRLDRDTSGVLLCAKTAEAGAACALLFERRKIQKGYLALVHGCLQGRGTITGFMRPKSRREGAVLWQLSTYETEYPSKTEWESLAYGPKASLLYCRPLTGRTHQIRVHLSSIGAPILGDRDYGSRKEMPGLFRPLLHASDLSFGHPQIPKKVVCSAPLPPEFLEWQQRFLPKYHG